MWIALLLALALPLSNAARYLDTQGDTTVAPDVGVVSVRNDDDGVLTWTVGVPNRSRLERGDRYTLWLDTDLNVHTGAAGADWAIVVDGGTRTVALARWSSGWRFGVPHATLRARWRDGLVVAVGREEIGRPAQVDFSVGARGGGEVDHAPDRGDWRFGLIVSPS